MQREYRLSFSDPELNDPFQDFLAMGREMGLDCPMSLRDVFEWIDSAYDELPDHFAQCLTWRIDEVIGGEVVRTASDTLTPDLWQAYCEDYAAFRMWLECFGWGVVYAS